MATKNFMIIYRGFLLIMGVVMLIIISAFSHKKLDAMTYTQHEIELVNNAAYQLINIDEIEKTYKKVSTNNVNEINISMLEDKISEHPLVAHAEVFSSLNGKVSIQVFQKIPIARLIHQKPHNYIDSKGEKFPLSKYYSVEVPLVSGSLNDSLLQPISEIILTLQNDTFFKNFFAQLQVEKNGNINLYPTAFDHKVELGNLNNFSQKIENLKAYYQYGSSQQQLKELKYINVQYKDQVICGKRN